MYNKVKHIEIKVKVVQKVKKSNQHINFYKKK